MYKIKYKYYDWQIYKPNLIQISINIIYIYIYLIWNINRYLLKTRINYLITSDKKYNTYIYKQIKKIIDKNKFITTQL